MSDPQLAALILLVGLPTIWLVWMGLRLWDTHRRINPPTSPPRE